MTSISKRPKFRLTRPEPLEAQVLRSVRQALEWHRAVSRVYRVNSGSAWLKGKGGKDRPVKFHDIAGMSDLWAWLKPEYGARQVFVEVKRPSTRADATDLQMQFLADASRHGHIAFVAASADETIAQLDAALGAA